MDVKKVYCVDEKINWAYGIPNEEVSGHTGEKSSVLKLTIRKAKQTGLVDEKMSTN